jgi:hypothetical protein
LEFSVAVSVPDRSRLGAGSPYRSSQQAAAASAVRPEAAAAVFNDSSSSQRGQQPPATVGSQKAEGRERNSECSFESD